MLDVVGSSVLVHTRFWWNDWNAECVPLHAEDFSLWSNKIKQVKLKLYIYITWDRENVPLLDLWKRNQLVVRWWDVDVDDWWCCGGFTDATCCTLDGLGGVLLVNKDLEQAQFGFDAFILLVLVQHGHAVLLLYIPIGREVTWSVKRLCGLFHFDTIGLNKHCSSALFSGAALRSNLSISY